MQAMGVLIRSAAVIAAMSLATSALADPVILQIESPFGPDHSSSKAMETFRTELVARTHGALDIEFSTEMKGGSPKEIIDGVHAGNVFAVQSPIPAFSRLVPEIEALGLPFVFRDADHARRAVDGATGKFIESRLVAKGFVPLAWMALGLRHVANAKRPLKSIEDFKNLKIRVQPSEIYMAAFRALGATPVAMDFSDVYAALRQHDIDAAESPYYPIYSAKFYEVEKYLSDTGHAFDLIIFVASRKAFMALPPEQQKALKDAARIAAAQEWQMQAAVDDAAFTTLKANGMQFDPIPDATRVAFKNAMSGVINSARQRLGAGLVDQVVAAGRR